MNTAATKRKRSAEERAVQAEEALEEGEIQEVKRTQWRSHQRHYEMPGTYNSTPAEHMTAFHDNSIDIPLADGAVPDTVMSYTNAKNDPPKWYSDRKAEIKRMSPEGQAQVKRDRAKQLMDVIKGMELKGDSAGAQTMFERFNLYLS